MKYDMRGFGHFCVDSTVWISICRELFVLGWSECGSAFTFQLATTCVYNFLQAKYIAECLDEIKQELKSGDLQAKSNAVGKLLYVSIISLFLHHFYADEGYIFCLSNFLNQLDLDHGGVF